MKPIPTPIFQSELTVIQPCRHGPMMFLKNDGVIGISLQIYGEWYESEIKALLPLLKSGDVVLDVGANIGTHMVPFAKTVGASGHVFAFEAQPLIHQVLCANAMLNDLVNVTCLNLAAGREVGNLNIPLLDPTLPQNFGGMNVFGHAAGKLVGMAPIDNFRLSRCNLIKIDVEGAEVDVLAGALATIRLHRPVLFVENNSLEGSPPLHALLDDLGYDCCWFLCRNFRTDNFRGEPEDIFASHYVEANLLCMPRENNIKIDGLEPLLGPDDTFIRAFERVQAKNH